ncbi:MAG: hypothetical protein QXW79_00495 [Thermoplasmata archaeon]
MHNIESNHSSCEAEKKSYKGTGKHITSRRKTKRSEKDINGEKIHRTLVVKSPRPYNADSNLDQCQPCICPEKEELGKDSFFEDNDEESLSTTDEDTK